jgi:hypothetical protein
VPWFHGEIGRQEAEAVLATRERSDGAFLLRFSESHPTKFTLTYLKVHPPSSRTPGRREVKNCLVRNLGMNGYALTESVKRGGGTYASVRQRTYPSIGAFIQSSSGRLKYGVRPTRTCARSKPEVGSYATLHVGDFRSLCTVQPRAGGGESDAGSAQRLVLGV